MALCFLPKEKINMPSTDTQVNKGYSFCSFDPTRSPKISHSVKKKKSPFTRFTRTVKFVIFFFTIIFHCYLKAKICLNISNANHQDILFVLGLSSHKHMYKIGGENIVNEMIPDFTAAKSGSTGRRRLSCQLVGKLPSYYLQNSVFILSLPTTETIISKNPQKTINVN